MPVHPGWDGLKGVKEMAKKILDVMKSNTVDALESLQHVLLSIEKGDSVNEKTGEVSNFVRCEAEVPRGYGAFSRCRFSVKIPDGKIKVEAEKLDEDDYSVIFSGLLVSYIDNNGNVYFRAEDYEVKKG